MGKTDIYRITVSSWDKHNGKMKRGYKSTLIRNNFTSNAHLRTVPVTVRWLFLGIVLTCGDHTRDTVEMSESQLRDLLESSWSVERALESLKELQLLTFEKIAPFGINRIEKNRKEKKGNSVKGKAVATSSPPAPSDPGARGLIAGYCVRWKARYGTNPPIGPKTAGQLNRMAKDYGQSRAEELIQAYLEMPDPWFVTKRHDVSTLLANLNAVAQFRDTGRMVTRAHLEELKERVDENLGPQPKGIEQILAEKARAKEIAQ